MNTTKLAFVARWNGESEAGIPSGSHRIEIILEQDSVDQDEIEFWREAVSQFCDGAKVLTEAEDVEEIESLDEFEKRIFNE